jgi:hypothetical protein
MTNIFEQSVANGVTFSKKDLDYEIEDKEQNPSQERDISYFLNEEIPEDIFDNDYTVTEVFRVLTPILTILQNTKEKKIKKQIRELVDYIIEILFNLQRMNPSVDISRIPEFHCVGMKDKSVLIEWIFNKFRIAFSIDNNAKFSSWYIVSLVEKADMASGFLHSIKNNKSILNLVSYVLRNS